MRWLCSLTWSMYFEFIGFQLLLLLHSALGVHSPLPNQGCYHRVASSFLASDLVISCYFPWLTNWLKYFKENSQLDVRGYLGEGLVAGLWVAEDGDSITLTCWLPMLTSALQPSALEQQATTVSSSKYFSTVYLCSWSCRSCQLPPTFFVEQSPISRGVHHTQE